MQSQWNILLTNAHIVTCNEKHAVIENGAIAIKDDVIDWIGPMSELIAPHHADEVIDVRGACVTPGLIDCHTHIVYGGNRAHEFALRLAGYGYAEIAQKGGGIQSTVHATRALSQEELLQQSLPRAKHLMQSGVTTLEIKSGYGLNLETELKILRVAKQIAELTSLNIFPTFLGAHSVPKEFSERADDYVNYLCEEMLPKISEEKLAVAVDVFCENVAFNLKQTEKIFIAAQKYQLHIKCHAEQLSHSGSAALAAQYGALSVDHLEHLTKEDVQVLATSGTVAVLLPGAFYFLRETQLPPVQLLHEHHVPIAIATDANPGTSPLLSMQLAMNMACVLFRLTPNQALYGATSHAAKALAIQNRGQLNVGHKADLAVWEVSNPTEICYSLGFSPLNSLINNGNFLIRPA